jgi:hypothetical protein
LTIFAFWQKLIIAAIHRHLRKSNVPQFHERFEYVTQEQAHRLLGKIERQLNNKFSELREENYCPNTKGYDYEKALRDFFDSYLGGAFDFEVRYGVLDVELRVKSALKSTENEFDVVAVFKNAVPRLVFKRLVPYDSVAFITETKQTLTILFLKADLRKFSKLEKLKVDEYRGRLLNTRFNPFMKNDILIRRPLRFLFYYERKADYGKIFQTLRGPHGQFWDVCVILKDERVFLNSSLPIIQATSKGASFVQDIKYPLLKAMFYTCVSVEGSYIDSWLIFWNLFRSISKTNSQVHPT